MPSDESVQMTTDLLDGLLENTGSETWNQVDFGKYERTALHRDSSFMTVDFSECLNPPKIDPEVLEVLKDLAVKLHEKAYMDYPDDAPLAAGNRVETRFEDSDTFLIPRTDLGIKISVRVDTDGSTMDGVDLKFVPVSGEVKAKMPSVLKLADEVGSRSFCYYHDLQGNPIYDDDPLIEPDRVLLEESKVGIVLHLDRLQELINVLGTKLKDRFPDEKLGLALVLYNQNGVQQEEIDVLKLTEAVGSGLRYKDLVRMSKPDRLIVAGVGDENTELENATAEEVVEHILGITNHISQTVTAVIGLEEVKVFVNLYCVEDDGTRKPLELGSSEEH